MRSAHGPMTQTRPISHGMERSGGAGADKQQLRYHGLAVVNIVITREQPLCCAITRQSDSYIRTQGTYLQLPSCCLYLPTYLTYLYYTLVRSVIYTLRCLRPISIPSIGSSPVRDSQHILPSVLLAFPFRDPAGYLFVNLHH